MLSSPQWWGNQYHPISYNKQERNRSLCSLQSEEKLKSSKEKSVASLRSIGILHIFASLCGIHIFNYKDRTVHFANYHKLKHIYFEVNQCADLIANMGYSGDYLACYIYEFSL
jgi:hypothetical protein